MTSEGEPPSEVLFGDPGDEGEIVCLQVSEGGQRLDRWLADQLSDASRAEVQRWIEAGLVTRRGRILKASHRVVQGDFIETLVPPLADYAVEPEPIPLTFLYEDADLLVVDKPAGMVVHPAAGNWHGTLVNAVLYHCPGLQGVGGTRRPGIVHRLDKDTSGAILVAKNDAAHRNLQDQFRNREVRKTYLALVYGMVTPAEGEIEAALARDVRDRKRMAVVPESRGRHSVTRYESLEVFRTPSSGERLTLLACHPLTGRTHQIRVHLAHIKHPIVGDMLYSGRRRTPVSCPRQFLHAHMLRFLLPATGQPVEFSAPLPADLQAVLVSLRTTG